MIADWVVVATATIGGPYGQFWGKVDVGVVSYVAGQECRVRLFDPQTLAWGADTQANQTTSGEQNEQEVIRLDDGRIVCAWSDRSAILSTYMTVMGRVYSPTLAPLTDEFRLTNVATTSWRPMLCAAPGGRWLAAWTEEWNEEAVWGMWDGAARVSGPHPLHAPSGSRQNMPDVAWHRGRVLWAFQDAANAQPLDMVRGVSSIHGAVTRSDPWPQAGNQYECRVASNGRAAVYTWNVSGTSFSGVWFHRNLEPPALLGASGCDAEADLGQDRGLIVWDGGAAVWIQRLSGTGQLDGQPVALASGLLPTPAGEVGRRQCDVRVVGDRAWVTYGVWSGANYTAMDVRLVVLHWTP